MATKRIKKSNIEASEKFLQYEEEIASHPAYAGMPDLRHDDGSIQWEAPSNRGSGKFQFTHDKRYKWWMNKATEIGISTEENQWISKVAKQIHPTKQRPCKICGRVMDIRYCYLSSNFIKRVNKLPFYNNELNLNELTHILDFVSSFINIFGEAGYTSLPKLLSCSQVKNIPSLPHDLTIWISWIKNEYIPKEPSMLGPGAMANPPDRLDGFHTYNRCCRPVADKGRSKENLASYSSDRRAFENWSDGNWIIANKLMGFINSNSDIKNLHCANTSEDNIHPRPCNADHIGPISLGFCHRPEFQLLCTSCNSAKNNRMYYSDVKHLISIESQGIPVTTWYATPIWQECKYRVNDKESALRLSRIMRDNRNIAMNLLFKFAEQNEFMFLLSLLNLHYADYEYFIDSNSVIIDKHIVSASFSKVPSTLRYVNTQKIRKIRVAFSSLYEYVSKDNRNSFNFTSTEIERILADTFDLLSTAGDEIKNKNEELLSIFTNNDTSDYELEQFITNLNYQELLHNQVFKQAKDNLVLIMQITAAKLSSMWNDPRYSREYE